MPLTTPTILILSLSATILLLLAVCAFVLYRQHLLLALLNALGLRIAHIDKRLIQAEKSIVLVDRRVDRCNGAAEVEARRLDALSAELSEHLQDPIGALAQPPRFDGGV